jgi:ubiquinone/menaquinone biosynthesis C-methylase UbiE
LLKKTASSVIRTLFPEYWKGRHELTYWKRQVAQTPQLSNAHYVHFYTEYFGLSLDDYAGKRVLDIGCGPRGSLEWAEMTERRVGLDPLADQYQALGANRHAMEYANAPSERMPFDDDAFDIVCSFNSLDHVNDVDRTIGEIKRVLRPAGDLLLIVEINHPPTACEPHCIAPAALIKKLAPELTRSQLRAYRDVEGVGVYRSIEADDQFDDPSSVTECGWLTARLESASHS